MKSNKVFKIELCQEDACRIINGLKLLEGQLYKQIESCSSPEHCDVAYLEWTYASELLYMMDNIFNLDEW